MKLLSLCFIYTESCFSPASAVIFPTYQDGKGCGICFFQETRPRLKLCSSALAAEEVQACNVAVLLHDWFVAEEVHQSEMISD